MPRRRTPHAHSRRALLLAALAAGTVPGTAAVAADAPPPVDFLEYLGSWEAGDADWLVADAAANAFTPTASTVVPRQPNPTMTEKRGTAQSPATTEHKP